MSRGLNLERKINATIVRILGEKYSIQEMMDAFGLGRTIIYNYKKNKMPEDFLEEHEQNIKDFVQDLEDILYTLEINSDSHQKIPDSLVDILKTQEDILDDIVDYSNFYISEQHEKWYKNYDREKHRKDIMDKPYITFISPELGKITLTYREYREFLSRKRVAIRNYKEIDFNFEEFFNKQLEENEDEIGLLYDILRYNSNFLTAVKYRDQSVMETIYRNVRNSGDGINYMKKMNDVINIFRERKWITEITNDEWTLISENIDKIEIDKYNNKEYFIELIKSLGLNKKSTIPKPIKPDTIPKPIKPDTIPKPIKPDIISKLIKPDTIPKPIRKHIIPKSEHHDVSLKETVNETSHKPEMLKPPENYKDENPKSMENNINNFIERIREYESFSDEHPNNQEIYDPNNREIDEMDEYESFSYKHSDGQVIDEMDKLEELYRNINQNKEVEDMVVNILSDRIGLYGINDKRVVSYMDVINKTFDSFINIYGSLERVPVSSISERILSNLDTLEYSS